MRLYCVKRAKWAYYQRKKKRNKSKEKKNQRHEIQLFYKSIMCASQINTNVTKTWANKVNISHNCIRNWFVDVSNAL